MSTAGKVLTVLVLLVTIGWIVMLSAVTQLNTNWEQKILAQEKSLENATLENERVSKAFVTTTEQARMEQDATDRDLRLILVRIATAEGRRSSVIEDLSRIKNQVADSVASAETSKANLAIREAEKIAYQGELDKTRDAIAKAQALNADLRSQLAQLQTDFKRILAENAAKLDKITKEAVAKPASSVREVPSS